MNRREWIAAAPTVGLVAASLSHINAARAEGTFVPEGTFGYCLNTATIMGQKLSIVEEVEIAAKAGYQAIEPWIRELDAHVGGGHSLRDLGKRIADLGLSVESSIGFHEWAVDDEGRRSRALEQAKKDMDSVRQIGGKRIAAPPTGATEGADLDLRKVADRYRTLLEVGDALGVIPEVEIWGFSRNLNRLSDAAFVAIQANHPRACILADVYHLYRGGSDFAGLRILDGNALPVLHMNDYPATPKRTELTDAQRVYPGDGTAPLATLFRTLQDIGFRGYLSLELFNRDYWSQDALTVARTGLEKMRRAVEASIADPKTP